MNRNPSKIGTFCLVLLTSIAFQGCSSPTRIINDQSSTLTINPETIYQQGMKYSLGKNRDDAKAFLFLRRAAQQGHLQATYALAWIYLDGRGTPPNPEQAAKLFTSAAKKGNANSQYMLSTLYAQGRGLPRDGAASIYWLQQAAQNGQQEAKKSLGNILLPPKIISPKR